MTPIDTAAEATAGDEMVAHVIRGWSIERRSIALSNLTALVRASSRAAWRRRHPEQTHVAADIDWAESQYGPEIGEALRLRFPTSA
jgi:hypothetical protein